MNFKTKLFTSMVILPSLLFSSVELNDNSCATPYSIPQLSGISDDVTYGDDYSNKHSKDIYLSFNSAVDGNFSMELLKDNDKKMKYQLFMGNSCNALTLVQEPNFAYTHNVNLQVVANRDYIIKIVKHSNGNSRYNIAYSFIADKSEIIHGHQLPPQPDPDLNNATLGGVDSNENGVRDDVERAIYKKYDKKLHAVNLMDRAKFLQRTLVEPIENATTIEKDSTRFIDCQVFLGRTDSEMKSKEWRKKSEYVDNIILNTVERVKKYMDYNIALSGGMYGSSVSDIALKSCSQEVKDVLEEMEK